MISFYIIWKYLFYKILDQAKSHHLLEVDQYYSDKQNEFEF